MTPTKGTQNARVYEALLQRRKGGLTSREAYDALGITRLGARIWDLRHIYGYEIEGSNVKVRDRFGNLTYVERYVLK